MKEEKFDIFKEVGIRNVEYLKKGENLIEKDRVIIGMNVAGQKTIQEANSFKKINIWHNDRKLVDEVLIHFFKPVTEFFVPVPFHLVKKKDILKIETEDVNLNQVILFCGNIPLDLTKKIYIKGIDTYNAAGEKLWEFTIFPFAKTRFILHYVGFAYRSDTAVILNPNNYESFIEDFLIDKERVGKGLISNIFPKVNSQLYSSWNVEIKEMLYLKGTKAQDMLGTDYYPCFIFIFEVIDL